MNNRFVKNILLVAVISFLFFGLIKIVGNMILYNSMEINETERFFLVMCKRTAVTWRSNSL